MSTMPGMDRVFEKKFDTTKMSAEELKMCKEEARVPAGTRCMMDQDLKKKFDTIKTSPEELMMCEEAKTPLGMDQEFKKKIDTMNASGEEQKMLNVENARRPLGSMDQEYKKRFDPTMMSAEELKVLNLEDAKRPPGQGLCPGGTLHQQGGPALSKAGRYPVVLAGVAALTGISTFLYYRTVSVQQLQGKADEVMDSIRPGTATATADAPR